MTLDSTVKKAKATTKKYWKWILGVFIAVMVAYVAWRLKRQQDEVRALRTEKLVAKIKAKDLAARAKNTEDADAARALRDQAEAYVAAAADKDTQIQLVESQIGQAKESVQNARDWQELERQASDK